MTATGMRSWLFLNKEVEFRNCLTGARACGFLAPGRHERIGLDIYAKTTVRCCLDETGEIVAQGETPTTPAEPMLLLANLQGRGRAAMGRVRWRPVNRTPPLNVPSGQSRALAEPKTRGLRG